jgi:hypothetical protein
MVPAEMTGRKNAKTFTRTKPRSIRLLDLARAHADADPDHAVELISEAALQASWPQFGRSDPFAVDTRRGSDQPGQPSSWPGRIRPAS